VGGEEMENRRSKIEEVLNLGAAKTEQQDLMHRSRMLCGSQWMNTDHQTTKYSK
jgi:hypothetical protein